MFPLLKKVLLRARQEGHLKFKNTDEAAGLYLDLLIGDQQIRRVIGRLPSPSKPFCEERSKRALRHLRRLLS